MDYILVRKENFRLSILSIYCSFHESLLEGVLMCAVWISTLFTSQFRKVLMSLSKFRPVTMMLDKIRLKMMLDTIRLKMILDNIRLKIICSHNSVPENTVLPWNTLTSKQSLKKRDENEHRKVKSLQATVYVSVYNGSYCKLQCLLPECLTSRCLI